MQDKELIKEIISEERGILPTTDTTLTTCTTLIDNWGYVNIEEGVLLEQISKKEYIYNIEGKIGVARLEFRCPSCAAVIRADREKVRCSCKRILNFKDHESLYIGNRIFKLKNKSKEPLYLAPSIEEIQDFLVNVKRVDNTKKLFEETESFLLALFDFKNKQDVKICTIFIFFSYVLPYFNSAFYLGIDATKGAGKTTLLEILSILCRHGFLADVSPASIPRLKQKYDLSIFVDEVDELKNSEDIEGLLRKGQRKGNKYVRLNKNSLEEEIFEAFGIYGYSFRSMAEDAFKQRSIIIRTARAKDNRLSVINLDKLRILKPLFNKIFFWYIKNIFVFSSISSEVVEVARGFTHNPNQLRNDIYTSLTKNFTKKENAVMKKLFGRNSEISYLFIQVCKFLGVDLIKDIQKTMQEKQDEEEIPDNYYFELIKNIFEDEIKNKPDWLLTKGEFSGYRYFPKTKFYMRLITKLKEHNLLGIGMKRYNSLLKDIGFIKNYNIKNQKEKGSDLPVICLIFSKDVLKKLNIEYEVFKVKIEKIKINN